MVETENQKPKIYSSKHEVRSATENRFTLTTGSVLAAMAVILGAFGAHALKSRISPEQVQIFETGVRYQFYHSLALIVVYLLSSRINSSLLKYAGNLFIAGIILFSGSLYLLSCSNLMGTEGIRSILGPITPLGGLCFITGWVCMIMASLKANKN